MGHPIQVPDVRTAADLNDVLRSQREGNVINKTDPITGKPRGGVRGAIAFVLLEDLESGGSAEAFILRKSFLPLQIITIKGNVTGGSFKVHYGTPVVTDGPDVSGEIPYDATPAEAVTALEQIESIGEGGVSVTFGESKYINAAGVETTVITGRWFVEFLKIASPELLTPFEVGGEFGITGSPNLITTETHILKPTTKQETIYSITPVADPTPQEVGSIGQAIWHHGIGFGVVAVECRDFAATVYV